MHKAIKLFIHFILQTILDVTVNIIMKITSGERVNKELNTLLSKKISVWEIFE